MANKAKQVSDIGEREVSRIPSLGEIGLSSFLPYLLNKIAANWNLGLQEDLRKEGLNTVKMRILAVLTISNGLSIKDLVQLTVIEQSTLSRALDAMEAQRLIGRRLLSSDKRVRAIFITELGRATYERIWPRIFSNYQMMLNGIEESERLILVSLLSRLLRNLDDDRSACRS